MQKQWTIEARADFADKGKCEAIDRAVRIAAAHINAQLQLLKDGQEPEVACFSDDFFDGVQAIEFLGDPLGDAIAAHNATVGGNDEQSQVDPEMLEALRQMKG